LRLWPAMDRVKVRKLSINVKLIATILGIMILCTSIMGVLSYYLMYGLVLDNLKQELIALAQGGSMLIDGDQHQMLKPGDEATVFYRQQRKLLQEYQRKTGVRFVYTMVAGGNMGARYVIDADTEKTYQRIGLGYKVLPSMLKAFKGNASTDDKVISDVDGKFLSGYAPIRNSQGQTVAILGVDLEARSVYQLTSRVLLRVFMVCLIGLLCTTVLSLIWSHRITKAIVDVIKRIREMANKQGNLRQEVGIHTGDEIEVLGDELTGLMRNIGGLVANIRNIAREVQQATGGILAFSESKTSFMNEMSASAENMATYYHKHETETENSLQTLESINAKIHQIAQYAEDVMRTSSEADLLGQSGLDFVHDLHEVNAKGAAIVDAIGGNIASLEKRSEEIEGIANIIGAIAEQTNLLALNAAIEAARAGESGAGFSVIADQVQRQADISVNAVGEVDLLVTRMRDGIAEVSRATEQIEKRQVLQYEAVQKAENTFRRMEELVGDMRQRIVVMGKDISSITSDNDRVDATIKRVSSLLRQAISSSSEVSLLVEQETASFEEIVASIRQLAGLVKMLDDSVRLFEIG